MEGGRQADVAKGILSAKNFPYIVAAPLLLQVRLVTALAELTGALRAPASARAAGCSPHACASRCVHDPPAWSLLLALRHSHVLPQASPMMFLASRIRAAGVNIWQA